MQNNNISENLILIKTTTQYYLWLTGRDMLPCCGASQAHTRGGLRRPREGAEAQRGKGRLSSFLVTLLLTKKIWSKDDRMVPFINSVGFILLTFLCSKFFKIEKKKNVWDVRRKAPTFPRKSGKLPKMIWQLGVEGRVGVGGFNWVWGS